MPESEEDGNKRPLIYKKAQKNKLNILSAPRIAPKLS